MYALVTGASAGIGLEITKYLAQKGYDLIITARREDRLQKLRAQILEKYPDRKVIVIAADLSDREECRRLFAESIAQAGSQNIDFVVNNAGMGVYGPDADRSQRDVGAYFVQAVSEGNGEERARCAA